jgi:hypothetical protein
MMRAGDGGVAQDGKVPGSRLSACARSNPFLSTGFSTAWRNTFDSNAVYTRLVARFRKWSVQNLSRLCSRGMGDARTSQHPGVKRHSPPPPRQ